MESFLRDPKISELLDVLETESERLNRFLNELSENRSLKGNNSQETFLFEALEETIYLVRSRLAERNIRMELPEAAPITVPLSKDQLKQIFLNLFYNSIDALERTKKKNCRRIRIEVRTLQDQRWVEIRFQDNGIGMSPEQLSMIFEPFYTTKEKGTGLGLYNIQKEVLRVGGDIQLESTEGKGALFLLKLPVVSAGEGCP